MALNPRLHELLNVLTPREKATFRGLLTNSGLGNSDKLTSLFDLLSESLSSGEINDFDRKGVYVQIFPNESIKGGKLEKTLTVLHQLLKEFAVNLEKRADVKAFEEALLLFRFYRQRGLDHRASNLYEHIKDRFTDKIVASQESLRVKSFLDIEKSQMDHQQNPKKAYLSLEAALESHEEYFLFNKLLLLNQYLLSTHLVQFDPAPEIQEMLNEFHVKASLLQRQPLLRLSFSVFEIMKKDMPEESDFKQIQALFSIHQADIDPQYYRILLTFLRNFYTIMANKWPEEYTKTLFNLSKIHYQKGYLYYDDKMHVSTLIGVSQNALLLKNLSWAERFIAKNESKITGDTTEKVYINLAKSNLFFYQGQYNKCLELLPSKIPLPDFHLMAKRLELKCYYELHHELFSYKLDAFRMFLSRSVKDTLNQIQYTRNCNFVNMLCQLQSIAPSDNKKKQKILMNMMKKEQIADKFWLKEKIMLLR